MDKKSYCSWNVSELKVELKRRGASTKGRKSDLVERLEFYDKNLNFTSVPLSPNRDPEMQLPPAEAYRDINGDSQLPPVEKGHVKFYFERFNKKLDASEKLYEARFLLTARSATVNDFYYIKGVVKKTMKKLQYEVDIKLDSDGEICECHCECPAGAGIEAHCKHIGVVLLAILHCRSEKIILTSVSQTQVLQSFHKPKKIYSGTPVRAQHLPRKKEHKILFHPYPIECMNKSNYNSRVRNLMLNYKSTMPFKQLCQPANPIAIQQDHNYLKYNDEEVLLQNLKLSKITLEDIREIEQSTHGQSQNITWCKLRSYRITASCFHTVCHLQPRSQSSFAKQLLDRKPFTSRATAHGLINEMVALNKYREETDLCPISCGLFISKEKPYLGASPDALLGEETIIEVKCPYISRQRIISPETVPYLIVENGILTLKKTTPYFYQIQGQLYCTGKKYCNLIIYTYKDMKIVYLERDEKFIIDMVRKLGDFYHNFLKPEIINKYLYKNYYDVIKKH